MRFHARAVLSIGFVVFAAGAVAYATQTHDTSALGAEHAMELLLSTFVFNCALLATFPLALLALHYTHVDAVVAKLLRCRCACACDFVRRFCTRRKPGVHPWPRSAVLLRAAPVPPLLNPPHIYYRCIFRANPPSSPFDTLLPPHIFSIVNAHVERGMPCASWWKPGDIAASLLGMAIFLAGFGGTISSTLLVGYVLCVRALVRRST